jgi:hypothetical protein
MMFLNKPKLTVAKFTVFFSLLATPAMADGLSAQDIVDKSLERNKFGFQNAIADITLKLVSKRGSERVREVEIKSIERDGLGKSLVRFNAPTDVAGTGFLLIEKEDADDDQYLYLPALGKVKRITGSQRNQRFMGTDLTYADMESRDLKNSTVVRKADEKVGGNDTYLIEAVPKDGSDSQYSKTISWIHKKSFVPLKVDFYDKRGKLLKTLKVRRLEKREGNWISTDSWIKNVQKNTQTFMIVNDIDFKSKLDDSQFTERALTEG